MSSRPELAPFFPIGEAERRRLLGLARATVQMAACERRRLDVPPEANPLLLQPGACFVSLHKAGLLRGCIGQVAARHPLYRAVVEAAYSAAMEDPRFTPLTPQELPEVSLEISVLSPFFAVRPEEILVGTHGLLMSREGARGLLLPQVAKQYNWDARRFLEETCLKAGLEPDAWKRGARIQAFTAEVFGEESAGGNPLL